MDKIICNLLDVVDKIIDYKARKCMGNVEFEEEMCYIPEVQEQLLKLATPMIQSYGVSRKVTAESVKDIIKQLSKGKINVIEATKLVELITAKAEAEIIEEAFGKKEN